MLDAGGQRRVRFPLVHQPLELGIIQVDDVEPDLEHVVDAALAEADPHVGIRIPAIRRRVVVDADDVQDRPRRQQRRRSVRVDVVDVPVEIEVIDRAEDLGSVAGRVDRLEGHGAPAHVHVRLERVDARIPRQTEVAIRPDDGIGRHLELVVGNVP
jgi:hypothetical protein